jgi:hypothetical protein
MKMAQPMGLKGCLIWLISPYSVENVASNRGEVCFENKVYNMRRVVFILSKLIHETKTQR